MAPTLFRLSTCAIYWRPLHRYPCVSTLHNPFTSRFTSVVETLCTSLSSLPLLRALRLYARLFLDLFPLTTTVTYNLLPRSSTILYALRNLAFNVQRSTSRSPSPSTPTSPHRSPLPVLSSRATSNEPLYLHLRLSLYLSTREACRWSTSPRLHARPAIDLSATSYWEVAALGWWLLIIGYWLLVVGRWSLVVLYLVDASASRARCELMSLRVYDCFSTSTLHSTPLHSTPLHSTPLHFDTPPRFDTPFYPQIRIQIQTRKYECVNA